MSKKINKIMKTIDFLNIIATEKNTSKLPKKIKLLSPEVKDEFRILTYDGFYEYKDGCSWAVYPEYLHLNDEIEILDDEMSDE